MEKKDARMYGSQGRGRLEMRDCDILKVGLPLETSCVCLLVSGSVRVIVFSFLDLSLVSGKNWIFHDVSVPLSYPDIIFTLCFQVNRSRRNGNSEPCCKSDRIYI